MKKNLIPQKIYRQRVPSNLWKIRDLFVVRDPKRDYYAVNSKGVCELIPAYKRRRDDSLFRFYQCMHWTLFGEKYFITRELKLIVCRRMKIKRGQFWKLFNELKNLGLAKTVELNKGYYIKKRGTDGVYRRVLGRNKITKHHYLISPHGKFSLIQIIPGLMFKRDFDLRGYCLSRVSMHKKQRKTLTWLKNISQASSYRILKKHKKLVLKFIRFSQNSLNPFPKMVKDLITVRAGVQARMIRLIQRKIPGGKDETMFVKWYECKVKMSQIGKMLLVRGEAFFWTDRGWFQSPPGDRNKPDILGFRPANAGAYKSVQYLPKEVLEKDNEQRAELYGWNEKPSADLYMRFGITKPGF